MTDDLQRERLEALMQELEGYPQRLLAAKGFAEQKACLLRSYEIGAEIQKIEGELWATFEALLADATSSAPLDPATRVAKLIAAFHFVVRLGDMAIDVLANDELRHKAVRQAVALNERLDAVTGGPQWALPFLDSQDVSVRRSAAAHLAKSMPERALPILRDISDNADSHAARMAAFKFLMFYEGENRKS